MRIVHQMPTDGMPHVDSPECPCHPLAVSSNNRREVRYHHREWTPDNEHAWRAPVITLPRG